MRAFPRRSMLRLAAPIMIGADAALGTALRAEGDSVPFYPPAFGSYERVGHSYAVPVVAGTSLGQTDEVQGE